MVSFQSPGTAGGKGAAHMARTAEERRESRHRLARETATIGYGDRLLVANLVNLSGGGAMIEADIAPELWDRVDLFLGTGSPIECAVRWLRGGRIGLEFAHETQIDCPSEQRDALIREVIRRNFPDADPDIASSQALPATGDDPRRTARRHPLIWKGVMRWQDEERPVRLRNISVTGVLVDAHIDLPEGADLTLDLGASGQYPATVGWSRGGQAGLLFDSPFELSALAAARPTVAGRHWERPSFLDRSSDGPSPWAEGWHRFVLSEVGTDLPG